MGHVRDLPLPKELPADMKKADGKFAIDVDKDFDPTAVNTDKKKKVTELRRDEGRRRALPGH